MTSTVEITCGTVMTWIFHDLVSFESLGEDTLSSTKISWVAVEKNDGWWQCLIMSDSCLPLLSEITACGRLGVPSIFEHTTPWRSVYSTLLNACVWMRRLWDGMYNDPEYWLLNCNGAERACWLDFTMSFIFPSCWTESSSLSETEQHHGSVGDTAFLHCRSVTVLCKSDNY